MKRLFVLSRPSTSFKKDPRLVAERWTLEVHFNYFEKEGEVSDERVVFTHPRSYRKFAEPLVTADLWKSYDCVTVLEESDWLEDLGRRETRRDIDPKHYVIAVDGWGALEVVAHSAEFEVL